MVGIGAETGWDNPHQTVFDLPYGAAGRKPQAVGNAEDMSINGYGRFTKGGVQNDIGGLAADARQRLQCRSCARHLAVVVTEELCAGL